MASITIALIGQPNVGKSTLFNVLTHGHVIVTNWPGTTIEHHEGRIHSNGLEIKLVDLPGIYSLTGFTIEEEISKNYLLKNKPDAIIVLVDSLAFERTLYLAIELLEMTNRVVIAVTKIDEAHSRGIHINYEHLEKVLKVPIIPISAIKGTGIDVLLKKAIECININIKPIRIDYGELEPFIDVITNILYETKAKLDYPFRWIAIKILEGDNSITSEIKNIDIELYRRIDEIRYEAMRRLGQDLAISISRKRFEFIETIARNAIAKVMIPHTAKKSHQIFYNPYLAPLISILIITGLFIIIFTINTGYPLSLLFGFLGYSEIAIKLEEYSLNNLISILLETMHSNIYTILGKTSFTRFIVEGILSSIFALILFIPLITIILIILGIFEDSGIFTRIAIGFHIFLQKIGLSGHAIFPISLCFGCNVPGLMTTRSNPNTIERLRLLMLLPFIPCQARLIILLAIASIIGGFLGAIIIPMIYLLSFSVVIGINIVLRKLAEKQGKKDNIELLLELPPIHRPVPKVVWWFTWFYLKHFIVKIGTIIILANILTWTVLNTGVNLGLVDDINNSIGASISRQLSLFLLPFGISSEYAWIIVFALIMGFIAKELFITTILVATGVKSIGEAFKILQLSSTSIVAIAVYVTLYIPCITTLATIYSESRSIKFTIKTFMMIMVIAYILTLAVYNITKLVIG